MEKRNILITGATGFLGSRVLEMLVERGYGAVVLKRSFSDTWRIGKGLLGKVAAYDIDKTGLEKPFAENRIDAVVHTATSYGRSGESASRIAETNLLFPLKLLELALANKAGAFINTDTVLPESLNFYAMSKRQFAAYAKKLCGGRGCRMKFINLGLEHMYGPKDNGTRFVPRLINAMLSGEPSIDLTEGRQRRDFIYIDDVAGAYATVLSSIGKFGEGFSELDVGTGKPIEIRELAMLVKELCNAKTELLFGAIPYREGEVMESTAKSGRLRELGWKANTNIKEGLEKTIEWSRGNRHGRA